MNQMNTRNYGIVTGCLVEEPEFTPGENGMEHAALTLIVTGTRQGQFDVIPFTARIPAERGNTVYDCLGAGDLITVAYTVRSRCYQDGGGHDCCATYLLVQSVDLLMTTETERWPPDGRLDQC